MDRSALQLEAAGPGKPGLLHTHLGLGGASPFLHGKGCRRLSNLLARTAGSPAHLGLEMDSWFCLLGPRGQRCGGAMGPLGRWGHHFLSQTGRGGQRRRPAGPGPYSAFTEHPLGPGLPEVTGSREPSSWGFPMAGGWGAVRLGASQTSQPGTPGKGPPRTNSGSLSLRSSVCLTDVDWAPTPGWRWSLPSWSLCWGFVALYRGLTGFDSIKRKKHLLNQCIW